MRLEFSKPDGQVINVNQEKLEVYIPEYRVSFVQELRGDNNPNLPTMATSQGLDLMKRNYSIAYLTGPAPVPPGRRFRGDGCQTEAHLADHSEGFRELYLSIGENNLIRRIEGVTPTQDRVFFQLYDLQVNRDIPDADLSTRVPRREHNRELPI